MSHVASVIDLLPGNCLSEAFLKSIQQLGAAEQIEHLPTGEHFERSAAHLDPTVY